MTPSFTNSFVSKTGVIEFVNVVLFFISSLFTFMFQLAIIASNLPSSFLRYFAYEACDK